MKQTWRNIANKIDALSERERIAVFAAALLVVLFVMTTLFIQPAVKRIHTLNTQMQQQQTELSALRLQVETLQNANPETLNRAHLDNLQQQIAEANRVIQGMQENLVPAQKMNQLLQDMLSRNPRLQLVAMRTLPASPLVKSPPAPPPVATEGAATATPPAAPGAAAVPDDNIFKHGVEITLEGSYADLHDYLQRIEQLPWHMFWARAELDTEHYPRLRLKLTIYTLSLDKAWLQV